MSAVQLAKFGVKQIPGAEAGSLTWCATVFADTTARTWSLTGEVDVSGYNCITRTAVQTSAQWSVSQNFSIGNTTTGICLSQADSSLEWGSCDYIVVSIKLSSVNGLSTFNDRVLFNYAVDTINITPQP